MIIILGAIVIYTMGTIFGYSLCNRHYKEDKRNTKYELLGNRKNTKNITA